MGLPPNWEKEYDSDHEEIWFNHATSMKLVLEKSEGSNYVYERFAHPGLDGTDIPGSPFSRQDEAREEAVMYMEDHIGPQGNVEAASTKLERMHPGDPVGDDKLEVHVENDGVWFSVNTYYFLKKLLSTDETCLMVNNMMERYDKQEGRTTGLERMTYISGNDDVENTYNWVDKMEPTSTISFVLCDFTADGEPVEVNEIYDAEYVILRLHQSGDVRSNYSQPFCFRIREPAQLISGLHNVEATATGEDGETYQWYSDDGGIHWYDGDGQGTDNWEFNEDSNTVTYGPSGDTVEFHSYAV